MAKKEQVKTIDGVPVRNYIHTKLPSSYNQFVKIYELNNNYGKFKIKKDTNNRLMFDEETGEPILTDEVDLELLKKAKDVNQYEKIQSENNTLNVSEIIAKYTDGSNVYLEKVQNELGMRSKPFMNNGDEVLDISMFAGNVAENIENAKKALLKLEMLKNAQKDNTKASKQKEAKTSTNDKEESKETQGDKK